MVLISTSQPIGIPSHSTFAKIPRFRSTAPAPRSSISKLHLAITDIDTLEKRYSRTSLSMAQPDDGFHYFATLPEIMEAVQSKQQNQLTTGQLAHGNLILNAGMEQNQQIPQDVKPVVDDAAWTVDGPDIVHWQSRGLMQRPWTNNPTPRPSREMLEGMGVLGNGLDEATPRPDAQLPVFFPHPGLSLPPPQLEFDFRMSVTLNPLVPVENTPSGKRNWISFMGGSWSGSFGSGVVLPGGQDSQIIHPSLTAELATQYLLQTNDNPPAFIAIKTNGFRTGPPDVLAALGDPEKAENIDPRSYMFRLFINMETGDDRYASTVNFGMWVGSGMRKGTEIIYDAYRIS